MISFKHGLGRHSLISMGIPSIRLKRFGIDAFAMEFLTPAARLVAAAFNLSCLAQGAIGG
jgi:hypothetical protein